MCWGLSKQKITQAFEIITNGCLKPLGWRVFQRSELEIGFRKFLKKSICLKSSNCRQTLKCCWLLYIFRIPNARDPQQIFPELYESPSGYLVDGLPLASHTGACPLCRQLGLWKFIPWPPKRCPLTSCSLIIFSKRLLARSGTHQDVTWFQYLIASVIRGADHPTYYFCCVVLFGPPLILNIFFN